jgi:hypothetical protein
MAFQRAVKFGEIIYRHHEATVVTHRLGRSTEVRIRSYMTAGSPVFVEHVHALTLDESLTFQGAEAWAQEQEDYAEYEDPAQAALDTVLEILTDDQAQTVPDAFRAWVAGVAYAVGYRVRYDGVLYKCVQAHTSQSDWTPDATPALWTRIGEPGEIPVWVQPTGSQDAYSKGDKVHYPTIEDPVYESTIDGNVWSPADYPAGWTEGA